MYLEWEGGKGERERESDQETNRWADNLRHRFQLMGAF